MGYAGWIKIAGSSFIRATSCDLKVSQKIDKPEVVDGTIDRTVYQLGPMEVGGGVAFPAVFELNGSGTAMSTLWDSALQRADSGAFAQIDGFLVTVRYSAVTGFYYNNCVVDSYEWSVTQSGTVDIKLNLIGLTRDPIEEAERFSSYNSPNTRIITWNDVAIKVGAGSGLADNADIRSFSCTVANNVKRYYSLNQELTPSLLTPTKRDISGKISIMGRSFLSDSAASNETRCQTDQTIGFRLGAGAACKGSFEVLFPEICIFEYEEIAITNELFETTLNYHVLPGKTLDNSMETFRIA